MRRTILVLGAVMALLVVVYLGGVVLLQYAFRVLTGERSQLAVVAFTLIFAALFILLRRRIQGFIDRRVGMSTRTASWLAWPVWAMCVVLAAIAVLLALLTPPGATKSSSNWGVFFSASLLVYPTVGAFLASRRPENLIGWLLCAIGFLFVMEGVAVVYAGYALSVEPDSLPGKQIALWVSAWFYFPMVFVGAALLILLFPDGHLPDRSWRVVPWLAAGGGLLWTLWLATKPGRPAYWLLAFYPHIRSPLAVRGVMGDFIEMLGRLGAATLLVMCVASVIGVFMRLGSARGDERQQIKWFAYAAVLLLGAPFVVALPVSIVLEAMGLPWAVGLAIPIWAGLLGIPVAIGIAILKYRLYDIDHIINRTLVYGALTALLAAGYFATIMALQGIGNLVFQVPFRALTGQNSALATVAATLVMAALFNPLRRRIQSFIDRKI
jgi:hypothetical protein